MNLLKLHLVWSYFKRRVISCERFLEEIFLCVDVYLCQQVSSEEESPIFHRALKTPTFDDVDLDRDILPPASLHLEHSTPDTKESFHAPLSGRNVFPANDSPVDFASKRDSSDIELALSRMQHELSTDRNSLLSSTVTHHSCDDSDMTSTLARMERECNNAANSFATSMQHSVHDANDSDVARAMSRMARELGIAPIDSSAARTQHDTNKRDMGVALARMERELGVAVTEQEINPPRDLRADTVTDHSSIQLDFSSSCNDDATPSSPRSVKRQEIPELSPHRTSSKSGGDRDDIYHSKYMHICWWKKFD